MKFIPIPGAVNIVIFGANGDLCRRKLIPALFNLYLGDFLPLKHRIFCIDHTEREEADYKNYLLEGVNEFSRQGKADPPAWDSFSKNLHYVVGDFTDQATYQHLIKELSGLDNETGKRCERLFYYSVAPRFIETISEGLFKNKVANNPKLDRIIIEKPFGHDLKSAVALNKFLKSRYKESQLYRIDHYLGKETVQNIMAFRFANNIFEPLWNNKHIDCIEISALEQVSVGSRAGYYDTAGSVRDMIQSHVLQLLCVTAMESPENLNAEEIRNKKMEVARSIVPLDQKNLKKTVVTGQYTTGEINGQKQVAYLDEPKVSKDSITDTYFAGEFYINNKRWKGVPFYLRTGKCLVRQSSSIVINFKKSSCKVFKEDINANQLIIRIQPENEIDLTFESKVPGLEMKLKNVMMDFAYKSAYTEQIPEAYEALILDAIKGDATLFMRADQVEAAWKIVMPIIRAIDDKKLKPELYTAGSWGPENAEKLLKKSKRTWTIK